MCNRTAILTMNHHTSVTWTGSSWILFARPSLTTLCSKKKEDTIVDFRYREILLDDESGKLRCHAKFCKNRSTHCGDIAIFKMAAIHHLGFVWGTFRPRKKSTSWSLIIMQNLVTIGAVILIIWKFQYLAHLAIWPRKWGAISINSQKDTPLHESAAL